MASIAKLIADEDRNPAHLVLGTYDIVHWYVQKVKAAKPRWPAMKVTDRMRFLSDLALGILDELDIPPPVRLGSTLGMGAFEPSKWTIYLAKTLFADTDWEGIAAQAGHVFHEFEHLAATFVAARYLAANKTKAADIAKALDIPADIAKLAADDPLPADLMPLGKDCHFRVTSEKNPAAPTDYYRSLQANIRKAQNEIQLAEENLSKLEKSRGFSAKTYTEAYAKKRSLDKQLERALREYELSQTEIGSNLVQNIVKSALLREVGAAAR